MPDIKTYYGTSITPTITLTSLASDTNLLTGRQSTEIDNTTAKNLDYLVSGRVTGHASSALNGTGAIEVWAVAAFDTDGSAYPDNVTSGGDAARTWTNAAAKAAGARLLWSVVPATTANVGYSFSGISVAAAFGGTLPPRFVLFVTHATGQSLNATAANHTFRVLPVYNTVG